MTIFEQIYDIVHEYLGNKSNENDIGQLEKFLIEILGMVNKAHSAKTFIENNFYEPDGEFKIKDVTLNLNGRKYESNDKKEVSNKEEIEKEENKKEKTTKSIQENTKFHEHQESTVFIKNDIIPLSLKINNDEIRGDFKPFIMSDAFSGNCKSYGVVLNDVSFFLFGKCKNCTEFIECKKCKIQKHKDGFLIRFEAFFLGGDSISIICFNEVGANSLGIPRMELIEYIKNKPQDLRIKVLDLYRNRTFKLTASFKSKAKISEIVANSLYCLNESQVGEYFSKVTA